MKKKVVLAVSVVLLLVMVTAMCVACTPSSDKIKEKLEDNGYKVIVAEATDEMKEEDANVTKTLLAYKKELSLTALMPDLSIAWYKDSKSAKEAYEEAQKSLEDMKSVLGTDTYQVKKKGNAVMMGTEEALKLV